MYLVGTVDRIVERRLLGQRRDAGRSGTWRRAANRPAADPSQAEDQNRGRGGTPHNVTRWPPMRLNQAGEVELRRNRLVGDGGKQFPQRPALLHITPHTL